MDARLDAFARELRAHHGGRPSPALIAAFNGFVAAAEADVSLLQVMTGRLAELPEAGTGMLAVLLGAAVERLGHAEKSAPGLLALFQSWLARLPKGDTPVPEVLAEPLTLLCQALVAHIARLPEWRQQVAADAAFMQLLEERAELSYALVWVLEALQRDSGRVVVLHPESAQGLLVRYENVASCFHLFSLLQIAIGERLPGGRQPTEEVVEASQGGVDEVHDQAWWHFGQPQYPRADIAGSVWGESLVSGLPVINGQQVILLWSPITAGRVWDSGFFGPALEPMPPKAVVERALSIDECVHWMMRLGLRKM